MIRFFSTLLSRLLRRHDAPHAHAHGTAGMPGMTMLDCETVMRELWDYLDEELTPERMAAIRAHVEMCQRCYPQYEFERAFLDAVAARTPRHSSPERVEAKVLAVLEAQGLTA